MLFLLLACLMYLVLFWLKALLSLHYARRLDKGEAEADITIIQPILSGDPLLADSLAHNLRFASESVRFLWLVDEDDTEALKITAHLAEGQARVAIVRCPQVPAEVNPKAFKLAIAMKTLTTEYFAVLDDDTLLTDESLPKSLYHLQKAMVVTGLPLYQPGTTFWSSLVAHFVNNNSVLTYLPLLSLRPPLSINGMFYLLRRQDVQALGGYERLWHQLSDDFAVAQAVQAHGGRIVQSVTPHMIRTSVADWSAYAGLMKRWFIFADIQVRQQALGIRITLLVFLALPALLLWAVMLGVLFEPQGWPVLFALLLLRHFQLRWLLRKMFAQPPALSWFMSLLVELLQPWHMFHARLSRKLHWRSRRIRVRVDGSFVYLKEHG